MSDLYKGLVKVVCNLVGQCWAEEKIHSFRAELSGSNLLAQGRDFGERGWGCLILFVCFTFLFSENGGFYRPLAYRREKSGRRKEWNFPLSFRHIEDKAPLSWGC